MKKHYVKKGLLIMLMITSFGLFSHSLVAQGGGTVPPAPAVGVCVPVTDLTMELDTNDLTLNWVAPEYQPVSYDTLINEDFETITDEGMLEGWLTIDADGDGHSWQGIYDNKFVLGYDSTKGLIASGSWQINQELSPDNYVIMPVTEGAVRLSYQVRAQSETWAAEHYAVLYSETGTEIADFTQIYEETLTAKDEPGTWYGRTVDIPEATKYIAFRHFNSVDQYQINIDNVVVEAWHYPVVTYEIIANGDTIVTGIPENETNYQELDLPNGDYLYCVITNFDDECYSEEECIAFSVYVPPCDPPINLHLTEHWGGSVAIAWEPPIDMTAPYGIIYTQDFETIEDQGMFEDWITIDADGDGHSWEGIYDNKFVPGYDSTKGLMGSGSWEINQQLAPDNYVILPNLNGAIKIHYNVRAQSQTFPSENYAVLASTTGTDIADFTQVFEETLTATKSPKDNTGDWFSRTVEVPEGTQYIAFRHFNTVDQYQINIDDIVVEAKARPEIVYNVYLADEYGETEVSHWQDTLTYGIELFENGLYTFCVEAVYLDNGVDTCTSLAECIELEVYIPPCNYPENVQAVSENDCSIAITWDPPVFYQEVEVLLTEDFETIEDQGMFEDWLTIDADGDGHSWEGIYDNKFVPGFTNSKGLIGSGSWEINQELSPDNYIILPEVYSGTVLKYVVRAQSQEYPSENYAVLVSTTGTDITDFTQVFEETLTATSKNPKDYPGDWFVRDVDLPEGTKYVAFRHFNTVDQYQINIDDVVIEGYSNPNITYNVYANGVQIEDHLEATNTTTQVYENGLQEYCVEAVYGDGNGNDTCVSLPVCVEIEVTSAPLPVEGLQAITNESIVELVWNAPEGEMIIAPQTILVEDFETITDYGMLADWTVVDADGDARNWYGVYDNKFVSGYNNSLGLIASESWIEETGAINPDNYLITPLLSGAANISYMVRPQSENYTEEHYAVLVSTTGTAVEDFVQVFDETLPASTKGTKGVRGKDLPGQWYARTVDLPIGTKYVAFRHYNCTDAYQINIDDVTVMSGEMTEVAYNVYQDGEAIATEINTLGYTALNLEEGMYEYCVEAVYPNGCISALECTTVTVTISSDYAAPINLVANVADFTNIILNWDAPEGKSGKEIILFEDFETVEIGTIPAGWIAIDADNDGNNWHCYEGRVMKSDSYYGGVLYPDNYLITPMVEGATTVEYIEYSSAWYGAEHYAIMASSTGTDIADFTIIFEETLPVNNELPELKSVDLPAGTKYVAIRHYNCSDNFYLKIDDVKVLADNSTPSTPGITYNVYANNELLVEGLTETTYTFEGLPGTEYACCVEAVYEEDGGISDPVCVSVTIEEWLKSVRDLTAVKSGVSNVTITWNYPEVEQGTVLAYVIYLNGEFSDLVRDGNILHYTFNGNALDDVCVSALYAQGESEQECIDGAIAGINEQELAVYPNPATNLVNIIGVTVKSVAVYNNIGQLVAKVNTNQVDVSQYNTGLYMFVVETVDGDIYKQKVMVK